MVITFLWTIFFLGLIHIYAQINVKKNKKYYPILILSKIIPKLLLSLHLISSINSLYTFDILGFILTETLSDFVSKDFKFLSYIFLNFIFLMKFDTCNFLSLFILFILFPLLKLPMDIHLFILAIISFIHDDILTIILLLLLIGNAIEKYEPKIIYVKTYCYWVAMLFLVMSI